MRVNPVAAVALIGFLLTVPEAEAQIVRHYGSLGIDFEQDSIFLPKTDQDYTQGTQLNWGGWGARRKPVLRWGFNLLVFFDKGLDKIEQITSLSPFRRLCRDKVDPNSSAPPACFLIGENGTPIEQIYMVHQVSFGVSGFTPRKGDPSTDGPGCLFHGCVLARRDPVLHDRPYASLTYLEFKRSLAAGRVAYTSDLTL